MASDDEDENFVIAAIAKARAMHIDSSLKELCAAHGFNPQNMDKLYTTVTLLDLFQMTDFHILTLNKFTNLQDVSIIQAPRVNSLDGLITSAPHLRRLMVIECNLTNLYGLHNCKKLQLLNVDSNHIVSFDTLYTLPPTSNGSNDNNPYSASSILYSPSSLSKSSSLSVTTGTTGSTNGGNIVTFPSLEILYVNDNQITNFGQLFTVCPHLHELYVARNRITTLSSTSFAAARSLHTLNIADNHIVSFRDISTLTLLPNLRHMIFSDPHWGENPVCALSNYSIFTTVTLPRLESLDTFRISPQTRLSTEVTFAKKRMYYTMRTQTLARNTGIVRNTVEKVTDYVSLVLLNSLPVLRHASKILQSYILVSTAGDTPLPPSILSNRILDGDIVVAAKEKLDVINKMILYRTAALLQLRTALSTLHSTMRTCSIAHASRMDIELHSGGNTRLEEGRPPGLITSFGTTGNNNNNSSASSFPLLPSIQTHAGDSWYGSCTETLRSKFIPSDFAPLHIIGIRITRVIRIHNRHLRSQFENRTNNILQNQPTLATAVMTNAVVAQNMTHSTSNNPNNTSFTSVHDQSLSTSFISTHSHPPTENEASSSSTVVVPLGINNVQNSRKGIEYVFYSPRWTPQGLQETLQHKINTTSSAVSMNSAETALSAMATEILEDALGDRQIIHTDTASPISTDGSVPAIDPYSTIARIVEEGFTEADANVAVPVAPLPFDYAVVPPPVYAPPTLNMKTVKRTPVPTTNGGNTNPVASSVYSTTTTPPLLPQTVLPGYQYQQKKIALGIPVTNSFTAADFPRLAEMIATTLESNPEFNWRRTVTPSYMTSNHDGSHKNKNNDKENEMPTKELRSSTTPTNNRTFAKVSTGVRPPNTYELAYGIYAPQGSSNTSITSFYAAPSGLPRSTSDPHSSSTVSSSLSSGLSTHSSPLWWPQHIPWTVAPQLSPSVWLTNAGIDTSSVMQRALLARALRYSTSAASTNNHPSSSTQTPPRVTHPVSNEPKVDSTGTSSHPSSVAMLTTPIVAQYPSLKTGSLLLCRTFPGNSLDLSTGRSTIVQHLANTAGESALAPAVSFYGDPLLTPLGQAAAAPVHSVNIPVTGATHGTSHHASSHTNDTTTTTSNRGKLWVVLDPALILPEYIVEWEYIFDGETTLSSSSVVSSTVPTVTEKQTHPSSRAGVSSASSVLHDDTSLQMNAHHVHDLLHSSSSNSTVPPSSGSSKVPIRSFLNLSTKSLLSSPTSSGGPTKTTSGFSPQGKDHHHPLTHTTTSPGSPSSPTHGKKHASTLLESALIMLHQLLQGLNSSSSINGPSFISISALLASLQVVGSSVKDGFLFQSLTPSTSSLLTGSTNGGLSPSSKNGSKTSVKHNSSTKRTLYPFTLQEEMDMRAFQSPLLTCAQAIVQALNNLRLETSYSYVDSFKRASLSPASSTNTLYPITTYGALLDQALIEVLCMQPWTYQKIFETNDTADLLPVRTVPSSVAVPSIPVSPNDEGFTHEPWSLKLIRRMYQIASAVHLRLDELLSIPITTLCGNRLPPMENTDNVLHSFAYTTPVMDETMLPPHTFDLPLRPAKLLTAASSLSILTSLTLSGCGLVGSLDKYSISSCVSLKYLDISHNHITSLTGLNKCAALWKLNASCNGIVTLAVDSSDTLPSVHPRKPNNVWMQDPPPSSSSSLSVPISTTAWEDNHSAVSDTYARRYSSSSSSAISSASSSAAESGSATPSSYASTSSSAALTTITAKLARQQRKRSVLYGCRFLQEIDLSFNQIGKVNDIIVIAPGCPLLRSLDLRGNPLTDNIVSVLIQAIPSKSSSNSSTLNPTPHNLLWSAVSSSVAENKTFAILLSCIPTLDSLNGRMIHDTDRAMIDTNGYRLSRTPVSNRSVRAAMASVHARMQHISNEHGWLPSLQILSNSAPDALLYANIDNSSGSTDLSLLPAPIVTEETDILEGGTRITPFLIHQIATDGNNKTHLVQLNRSIIPTVHDSQETWYMSYMFITMMSRIKRKQYATSVISIPIEPSIDPLLSPLSLPKSVSKVSLFQDIDNDIHRNHYGEETKESSFVFHPTTGQPTVVTLISDTPHGYHRSIGYTLVSQYSPILTNEPTKVTNRMNAVDDLRLLSVTPYGEGFVPSSTPSPRNFPGDDGSNDSSPMESLLYGTEVKGTGTGPSAGSSSAINLPEILTKAAEKILSLVRQGIHHIRTNSNGNEMTTVSSILRFPLQTTTLPLSNLFLHSTALTTKDAVHIFGSLNHLSYMDLSYNDLQSLIVLPWYLPSSSSLATGTSPYVTLSPLPTLPSHHVSDSVVNFDTIIMEEYMTMLPLLNSLALCSSIETLNLSSCNLQQLGISYPSNWTNTFIQSILQSVKDYHNREKESVVDRYNNTNGVDTNDAASTVTKAGVDTLPIPPLAFLHMYISPLTGCTNLTRLDLSRNRLTDAMLSLARLYLLPSLTMVSLEGNLLQTFDGIRQCRSLTELYAGNNKIGGSVAENGPIERNLAAPLSTSSSSSSSSSWSMGPRILRSLGKEFFPKLIILDLMGNPIVDVPGYREYALLHIPKLKVLDSIGIHTDEIKHIREKNIGRITLELLEEKALFLTQTKGTHQQTNRSGSAVITTDQTMEGELFQDENDGSVCLGRLTELDLSSSKYKEIDRLLPTSLPQLRKLTLDHNNFTAESLQGLALLLYSPVLRKLSLSHNKIHSLYPALGRNPPLNSTTTVSIIAPPNGNGQGSKTLAVFAPLLSTVTDALTSLAPTMGIQARTVTLPSAPLSNILDYVCHLEYLDLSYNGIPSMENLGLGSLPYLRILNLSHNDINRLQGLYDCSSLQELWLDCNQIKSIDNEAVQNLLQCPNLAVVSLTENSVRSLQGFTQPNALTNEAFNRLTTLDLRANRLTDILDVEPVFTLSSLVQLTIGNNPVARRTNYRNIIIGRMPYLFMLDGREITDDERITATAFMEAQTILTPITNNPNLTDSPVLTSNNSSTGGNGNHSSSNNPFNNGNGGSSNSNNNTSHRPHTPQVYSSSASVTIPSISSGLANNVPIPITNYSPMNLPFSAPLLSVSSLTNNANNSNNSTSIPSVTTPTLTVTPSIPVTLPNTNGSIANNASSSLSTIHSVTGTSLSIGGITNPNNHNSSATTTTTTTPASTTSGIAISRRTAIPLTTDISPIVSKPPSSVAHRHAASVPPHTNPSTTIITPTTERIHTPGFRGHAFTSQHTTTSMNNSTLLGSTVLSHPRHSTVTGTTTTTSGSGMGYGTSSSTSSGSSTVTLRGIQARQQQQTNTPNTTGVTNGSSMIRAVPNGETGRPSTPSTNPAGTIVPMGLGSWMKTLTKK